jgi:hypothetical protein
MVLHFNKDYFIYVLYFKDLLHQTVDTNESRLSRNDQNFRVSLNTRRAMHVPSL